MRDQVADQPASPMMGWKLVHQGALDAHAGVACSGDLLPARSQVRRKARGARDLAKHQAMATMRSSCRAVEDGLSLRPRLSSSISESDSALATRLPHVEVAREPARRQLVHERQRQVGRAREDEHERNEEAQLQAECFNGLPSMAGLRRIRSDKFIKAELQRDGDDAVQVGPPARPRLLVARAQRGWRRARRRPVPRSGGGAQRGARAFTRRWGAARCGRAPCRRARSSSAWFASWRPQAQGSSGIAPARQRHELVQFLQGADIRGR